MRDIPLEIAGREMRRIARRHESDAMTLMELGHPLSDLQIVIHADSGKEYVTTKRATEGLHRSENATCEQGT